MQASSEAISLFSVYQRTQQSGIMADLHMYDADATQLNCLVE